MGVDVGRDRLDAGRGAAADDADRRRGGDSQLVGEAFHDPGRCCVQTRAAFGGKHLAGRVGLGLQLGEDAAVPRLGHHALERHAELLQHAVEAHQAQPDRTFLADRVDCPGHARGSVTAEVFQHVVEEAHDVLDEPWDVLPLVVGLGVDRRQAADSGALVGDGQHDLSAQVAGLDRHTLLALERCHGLRRRVGPQQIGLARLEAGLEDLGPQLLGVHPAKHLVGLRRAQPVLGPVSDGLHEGVVDRHTVVDVQRLAVGVAVRLPDAEELLDLRVEDVEVDCSRPAAQQALVHGQRQRVLDLDEGDHTGGLAPDAGLLADGADVTPVGPDAAAIGREGRVLVPRLLDASEAVGHVVEEAADGEPAPRAEVREDRGRGHEPEIGHVLVQARGVRFVIRACGGHPLEQTFDGLSGQQVSIGERGAPEVSQFHGGPMW